MNIHDLAVELIFFARLAIVQIAVMGSVSALLFNATSIAVSLYEKLHWLENYLPILWRYKAFFEVRGHGIDYPTLVSISLANIAIQIVFLIIVAARLSKKISIRSAEPLPGKGNYFWLLAIALALSITVFLFTGPVDLQSGIFPLPPAASGYAVNCIVIPGGNIVLATLILARFLPSVAEIRRG